MQRIRWRYLAITNHYSCPIVPVSAYQMSYRDLLELVYSLNPVFSVLNFQPSKCTRAVQSRLQQPEQHTLLSGHLDDLFISI